ncbi:MAG: hypothetical protein ABSD78_19535 [Acidimicrobiales bacterium]
MRSFTAACETAAAHSTLSLGNAGTSVKTSNGVTWTLVVGWDQVESTEPPNLSVGLERTDSTGGTGYEFHDWSFVVTTATLKFDSTTGAGTLNSGTQASPIATVDLAFRATSSKKATCSSGSKTIYSGTLTGKVSLVTSLTGGGTVKDASPSFKTARPEITVDSSCVVPTDDCTAELLFVSGTSDTTTPLASGLSETVSGKAIDYVGVIREKALSAPIWLHMAPARPSARAKDSTDGAGRGAQSQVCGGRSAAGW